PARHQKQPRADRTIEAGQPQIGPRPLRGDRIHPVAGGIGNAGGHVDHRVRTLPLSVSKGLPPFLVTLASGPDDWPRSSLSAGPAGRACCICICWATWQILVVMVSVFL